MPAIASSLSACLFAIGCSLKVSAPFDASFLHPDTLELFRIEESVPPTDDDLFRAALFEKLKLKSGKSISAFDLFQQTLANAAAQGDVDACRLLERISKHRVNIGRTVTKTKESERRLGIDKHREFARTANLLAGLLYFGMLPEVFRIYQERYGHKIFSIPPPYWLDLEPAKQEVIKDHRRRQVRSPKAHFDVGYAKPPLASRFTTSNNPAHSRGKTAPPAWEALDNSLSKPAIKKSSNEKIQTTNGALAYTQLITAAIKGNTRARHEVVRRIFDLETKGLLLPPAISRRAKRKPVDPEKVEKLNMVLTPVRANLKSELLKSADRRYGSARPLEDYEYQAKARTPHHAGTSATSENSKVKK